MIRAIGVIVPAHNEEKLLPSCLSSLRDAARRLDGLPVELVVAADACVDRTAEVAVTGGATVVTVTARSVGAARAAGINAVLRGKEHLDPAEIWLATTDADTVVTHSWLRQQIRYAEQGWDAVAGVVRVADWSEHRAAVRSLFEQHYGAGDGAHPHVHGANLGFRASAYLTAGGFASLQTAEDHALVTSILATGGRMLRTRAVTVITSARRLGRAPMGFSAYLTGLEAAMDDLTLSSECRRGNARRLSITRRLNGAARGIRDAPTRCSQEGCS